MQCAAGRIRKVALDDEAQGKRPHHHTGLLAFGHIVPENDQGLPDDYISVESGGPQATLLPDDFKGF